VEWSAAGEAVLEALARIEAARSAWASVNARLVSAASEAVNALLVCE